MRSHTHTYTHRHIHKNLEVSLWGLKFRFLYNWLEPSSAYTGRTDAEAPILWPPDLKSRPIGNDPDAGKDWRQAEKGKTKDGWHHWLDGYEFQQALGVGEGQESSVCCSSWGHKESDMRELPYLILVSRLNQSHKRSWVFFLTFFYSLKLVERIISSL